MSQAPATPSGGTSTDLSFMARLITGVRYIVGKGAMQADVVPFGPSQPIQPAFQEEMKGRQWDYQTGINLNYVPRQNEPITFAQLRSLADNYDLLRLAIETRKDQLCKLQFRVKPKDKKKQEDARCKQLDDFFAFPDQEHDWETWLRMILEDLFVIDAVTVYPRQTKGGKLFALEPMDGALVKRVIDAQGRTPVPPEVAYQQYVKGVPAVNYSRDELIYKPRNLRTNRLYGFSNVEQVIMTVNIALRRQIHQLQYYTEGSTPDLIFMCPDTWNPDQIRQFQELWDGLLTGQTGTRRQGRFVPNGVTPYDTKQVALKDEYDEWLARIICYCFSLPPTAFVKQMNRATADSSKEQAAEEGLAPLVSFVNGLRNLIIWKYFGYTDLESTLEAENDIDPYVQAQIDQIYLQEYVISPNDVRDRLGLDGDAPEKPLPPAMGQPTTTGADDGSEPGTGKTAATADEPAPKTGTAKAAAGQSQTVEKVLRSKKRTILPINRNRDEITNLRDGYQGDIEAFLSAAGTDIAVNVVKEYEAGSSLDSIMAMLDFRSWDVLINPTQDVLEAAYKEGGAAGFAQISFNPTEGQVNLLNERALEYAQTRGAELIGMRNEGTKGDPIWIENPEAKWAITDTTREALRSTISSAIEDGLGPQELRQSIIDNFAFSPSRAEMIARTELAFADVKGNMDAYRSSGIVTGKMWILGSEHDHDDDCDANAEAGVVPLDDDFPSGAVEAPDHPNCVCDVLPVLADEMDTEGGE